MAGSGRRALGLLGVTSLLSLALFAVAPEPSFAGSGCPRARPPTLLGRRDRVAGRGRGCVGLPWLRQAFGLVPESAWRRRRS